MSGVTIVSPEAALEEQVLAIYVEQKMPVRRVWSPDWREPRIAVQEICAANPSVVAIHGTDVADALVLVNELDRRHPELGVLVINEEATPRRTTS